MSADAAHAISAALIILALVLTARDKRGHKTTGNTAGEHNPAQPNERNTA